jgi:transitional endoplasmic reticulum ATPase
VVVIAATNQPLADITYGFVGAVIASLSKEAAMCALRDILPELNIEEEIPPEVLNALEVKKEDFRDALKNVEPSAMREVFLETPQVKGEGVGGLDSAKAELLEAVEWPLKYPTAFDAFHTNPPKGLPLYSPPRKWENAVSKGCDDRKSSQLHQHKGSGAAESICW